MGRQYVVVLIYREDYEDQGAHIPREVIRQLHQSIELEAQAGRVPDWRNPEMGKSERSIWNLSYSTYLRVTLSFIVPISELPFLEHE